MDDEDRRLAGVKPGMGRGRRVAPTPRLSFDLAADRWWGAHRGSATRYPQRYHHALLHLRRAFGRRRLGDIAPADVAGYIARQREAGYKGWTLRASRRHAPGDRARDHLVAAGNSDVTTTVGEPSHAYDAVRRSGARRDRLAPLYADDIASTPAGSVTSIGGAS